MCGIDTDESMIKRRSLMGEKPYSFQIKRGVNDSLKGVHSVEADSLRDMIESRGVTRSKSKIGTLAATGRYVFNWGGELQTGFPHVYKAAARSIYNVAEG